MIAKKVAPSDAQAAEDKPAEDQKEAEKPEEPEEKGPGAIIADMIAQRVLASIPGDEDDLLVLPETGNPAEEEDDAAQQAVQNIEDFIADQGL